MQEEAPSGAPQTGLGVGRSARLSKVSGTSRTRQGDSLREIKIRDYTCGLLVTIVGLGLYSYYVRELMAALTLFSVAFFFLALVGLGALLVWTASVQVAIWARPASRNVIAFSRRLIAAYAKP
jgi:hypothetical protein